MPHILAVLVAGLLASGLLMLYAEPLRAMVNQWNVSPMYSYAFTVPLLSAYVAWSRRDEFARHPAVPSRVAGGLVVVAALALLVLGGLAAIQVLQQFAFLVMLVGIVLWVFGRTHLRLAAPALAYLLFMVPFWDAFTEPLHQPFQNNSAAIGGAMMQVVGVPLYREGIVIALPNVTIEVARQCSGVNYLIAVLALALPLSVLRLHGWGRRALLVGSALLIAGLANGLRVALIGTLAYLELGSPLHGPLHVLHGLFVAGVGYVALFAGLHVLESRQAAGAPRAAGPEARRRAASWPIRDAAGLAVLVWALVFVGTSPRSVPVALAMPLDSLPAHLGTWRADNAAAEGPDGITAWNDADAQFRRRYFHPDGRSATVDVWYFESQRQSREIVNFRAAGLHQKASARRIAVPGGATFTANLVRLPGELGYFWYVLDGEPEADQYTAKMRSLWTALRSGHSNGAAVMLRTRASASDDEGALAPLDTLAAELHAALGRHWHPQIAGASISGTK
jgi:EpsI family protein